MTVLGEYWGEDIVSAFYFVLALASVHLKRELRIP